MAGAFSSAFSNAFDVGSTPVPTPARARGNGATLRNSLQAIRNPLGRTFEGSRRRGR